MFKSFFKKNDDEDIFETVDPIVEKRRNEKFSKPLIYDEELKEKDNHEEKENIQKEVKKPPKEDKKVVKKDVKPIAKIEPEKKSYEMMDVISPMFGLAEDKKTKETGKKIPAKVSKNKKKRDNSLIQVISPFYGNFDDDKDHDDEGDNEAVLTSASEEIVEKNEPQTIDEVPTVEDNLRNIAKIVEEEQDQLKIIEERTGEFKLDFGTHSTEKQGSLIDEIDDNMSLDELMSLYEKKFKD